MHSGNMQFKQKPREEQAENGDTGISDKAGFMFGISGAEYAKALCSPRVKVGNEYVVKGQTVDQVYYALGAICKAMFERLFNWLVAVVNRALSTDIAKSFFIGILDIAGFEIFEFNTFEQARINTSQNFFLSYSSHFRTEIFGEFQVIFKIPIKSFVSTSQTKSFSSFSITICLFSNKKNIAKKELNGPQLILEWILQQPLNLLKNRWGSCPS